MDISPHITEKGNVSIATSRTVLPKREPLESPDPINFRDSTVIPALSQVSSPRESVSVSVIPDNDSYATTVFGDSLNPSSWRYRLRRINNTWLYTITTLLFVCFSLFGDSIRSAATGKGADPAFDWGFVVTIVYFATDWMRLVVTRNDYRWSFHFGLDVISTVTLLADISYLWTDTPWEKSFKPLLHKIGDTARVTSLTFRSITFLRSVRLARIYRSISSKSPFLSLKSDSAMQEEIALMNHRRNFERKMRVLQNRGNYRGRSSTEGAPKRRKSSIKPEETAQSPNRELKRKRTFARLYNEKKVPSVRIDNGYWDIPVESQVSKAITIRTLRIVFLIVLISAATMPYFNTEVYSQGRNGYVYGLELLEDVYGTVEFMPMLQKYIATHRRVDNLVTLVYLRFDGDVVWKSGFDYETLRETEREEYETKHLMVVFDMRTQTNTTAILDVSSVFFICLTLLVSALLVTNDFSTTVLFGLERMLALIRKIARDPLLLLSSKTTVDLEPEDMCCCWKHAIKYGVYEITLLEQALKKIGVMLALGLGTAGCETITSNIKTAGRLDPLIPGRKVLAAFCFISIRNFDILTELLSERLLIYVNKIAKLVHINSEKFQGAINRNLGEGFFIVWKFQADDGVVAGARMMVNPYSMSVRLKAALALIAVVKTLMKVARSGDMANFLGKAGMNAVGPFLSNQLSAGLHVGWAFEGPVGSPFKIDATYLSPHVNKTARIESVTRQYDVQILASDDFFQRLDDEIKPFLRHIDTVLLKGTSDPVMLYVFDVTLQGLGVSRHDLSKEDVEKQREKVKEAFEFNYFNVHELFTKSEKLKRLRIHYSDEFFALYQQATAAYIDGKWEEARELYHNCLKLHQNDGPTLNILSFMEKTRFQLPTDWAGIRTLTSK